MRVGILELLVATAKVPWSQKKVGYFLTTKQYASIMPQAVAVWCRQMGHQVFYATYFGQTDPKRLLPDDLDVVFVATYTQASALAYALAKLYRREGALTVLGGPHARSFPQDALRFFDLVVQECDRTLIADILAGAFDRGTTVSSGRPLSELPSVEERMPEIRASAFCRGRRYLSTTVPLLASVGCPYSCDFCVDWNSPYMLLPLDRLEADLRYMSARLPGVRMAFHDPNFAVRFDQLLDVLESIPEGRRNPYMIESSLANLRGTRPQRLQDTRCVYIAPGVESWSGYSNKAATGRAAGSQKVDQVANHFGLLHEYVQGLQANLIFGLDGDEGEEPVELTKEFVTRTPFVWQTFNIPIPFGGTPLYDQYQSEGRLLPGMPLTFYYSPYLATTLKHYGPVAYYQKLIELCVHSSSRGMLWQRVRSSGSWGIRFLMTIRCLGMAHMIQDLQRILHMLTGDSQFRAFHEGESQVLPEFYHREYERILGPYAPLLSREERLPVLERNSSEVPRPSPGSPAVAKT